MSRRRSIVNAVMVLLFAAVCIGAMEFLALNIGQPNPLSAGYRVRAVFADADGVPTAADVRVAGVQVGRVTAVERDAAHPNATVVTMVISDSRAVPVYSNGTAKVRPKTLLGEKYVDLVPGDRRGEELASNSTLPESSTTTTVEADQIFNAFDARTREEQRLVLQALDAATQHRAGDLQAIIPQLQQGVANLVPVAQVYEKDNPEMGRILTNLATLMGTLGDEHQQLAGLLANGNVALGAIAQRDQSLITTLREASNVAAELNAAAAPTVDAQRQALAKLAPALGAERGFLGQVVDPNAGCPGKPNCGIDEVFTGTLLGQLNYPNDQLTITTPTGLKVTQQWASLFTPPAGQHSALNIDLSFHCDTLQTTLSPVLGLLGLQGAIGTICPQLTGQGAATHSAGSSDPLSVLAAFAAGQSQ
ncbi:MAG TPA: MlaD family protein [Candidatus Dormibacteraeota bacterium]